MPVRTLRLRIGLPRRARRLAFRSRPLLGRGLEVAQTTLEVVEDETDRGLRLRRRRDQAIAVPDDEDAPGLEGDLELRELAGLVGCLAPLLGFGQQGLCLARDVLRTLLVCERGADNLAAAIEDDSGADLRGDLAQALEGGGSVHGFTLTRVSSNVILPWSCIARWRSSTGTAGPTSRP